MADKRITTVDEMRNPDENADFVLIVRGTQRDLRRLRLNLLKIAFDLHDDVADELTSLAGIDRLLISDEGSPGAPQKFVKLSTLQSFLTNAFDLHDDVPTELTEAAKGDRLLISDEDSAGDPQKWISVENLIGGVFPVSWQDTTRREFRTVYTGLSHSLGRVPSRYKIDLRCKTAGGSWRAGDVILDYAKTYTGQGSQNEIGTFALFNVSSTHYSIAHTFQGTAMRIPSKTSGTVLENDSLSHWQFLVTLY